MESFALGVGSITTLRAVRRKKIDLSELYMERRWSYSLFVVGLWAMGSMGRKE